MRRRRLLALLVLAAALLSCGCKSNNKGKIEGTKWSSDATTHKGETVPAGALTLEFRNDGSLSYKAGPFTFTGTYSLSAGDKVVMTLDKELGGRKVHEEKIRIDGDRLTMTDSDGTQVAFTKVK